MAIWTNAYFWVLNPNPNHGISNRKMFQDDRNVLPWVFPQNPPDYSPTLISHLISKNRYVKNVLTVVSHREIICKSDAKFVQHARDDLLCNDKYGKEIWHFARADSLFYKLVILNMNWKMTLTFHWLLSPTRQNSKLRDKI